MRTATVTHSRCHSSPISQLVSLIPFRTQKKNVNYPFAIIVRTTTVYEHEINYFSPR